MAKSMVKVDADKFYALLVKKGLDHHVIAEQLGYAKAYFVSQLSSCKHVDGCAQLPKNVPIILKSLYNLDPEVYLIKDGVKVSENKKNPYQLDSGVSIDYDRLREAIYLGVKEGIKEAVAEIDLKEVIKNGMIAALSWDSRKETK